MAELLPYALCSVEDVKEILGLPSSDHSKDNLITRKINQATMMVESATGRRFKLTQYTNQEYDATGTDQLVLKQRPVVITEDKTFSLGRRDSSLNEDDWDDYDADRLFVDSEAGVIDLTFSAGGHWNRYRVNYWAGYETIPADLAEACAILAAYLTNNAASVADGAVKRKQEGQREIEYFDTSSNNAANSNALFNQLGISGILSSYANYPLNPDK